MSTEILRKVVFLALASFMFSFCSRSPANLGEQPPKTEIYQPLATLEKYQNGNGHVGLLDQSNGHEADSNLKSTGDAIIPESEAPKFGGEDIADEEIDGDVYLSPFKRHQRRPFFVDSNAPISYAQLREISACPIPRLSLADETITTNAEWFVYTYCELDILKRNLSGNVIHYPDVPAMRHSASGYNLMRRALYRFLAKYLFGNAGLTSEQKLSLFERIFLVTQFRLLTVSEKQAVLASINQHGLHHTSRVYLANWRRSQFYSDHFDFSQDHQPRYGSFQAYGWIKNQSGAKLEGAAYQVASPYVGFKLGGISAERAYIEAEMANCFSGRPDGSFSYNFSVQYYVPLTHEARSGAHRHRRHCHRHQAPQHELSISADMTAYHQGFASVANIQKCARDFLVTLIPDTVSVTRPQTWPDVNVVRNQHIERLSWRVNTAGGPYAGCVLPKLNQDQVFDGFQWQDFISCNLAVNISGLSPMGKYWPLIYGRSAFDLIYRVKEEFLRGDSVMQLTEADAAEKIYTNLTMTPFTAGDRQNINQAIAALGLEQTLDVLLSTWYSKLVKTYFNYAKTPDSATIGKNYYKVNGIVRDATGNPIPTASVKVIDPSGNLGSEVYAGADGKYQITTQKIMNSEDVILQLRVAAAGYVTEHVGVPFKSLPESLVTVLLPADYVTPAHGGRIASPNGSVSLKAFPGAVNQPQTFSATNLTETNSPDFPGVPAASFEVNPSYQFNGRLQLFIAVNEALRAKVPPGDGWLLMTQVGNQWQLIPSVYHRKAKVITASVTHFSRFMLVLSGQTLCYKITDTDISVCVPIAANLDHHPMSSIFERRTINSTWELPGIIAEMKSRLQSGGWKPGDIAVLDNPDNYTAAGMAATCGSSSCPPLADAFPLDFKLPPRDEITIGSITGNVTTTSSARMALQAEQCSINPQVSLPQVKVNTVNNTDIGLNANVSLNNVTLNYPCVRADHRCKRILFGSYCYDWPVETRCTDNFNGSTTAVVQGFNQAYSRNLNEPINWTLAGTFDDGSPVIDTATPPLAPRPLTLCADVIGCVSSDANYRIQDEVVRQYKSSVANQFRAYALGKLSFLTLARLNLLTDPKFDSTNCYGQELPNSVGGVSAGIYHTCAIIDGGAKCWGHGYPGQLGHNSQSGSPYPVQVEGLTNNVTAIAVGYAHSCAIVNGGAKCWGNNSAGQLGNNSTAPSTVPVQVEGLTSGVTAIATGNNHSCAIVNGGVKCWGNSYGIQDFGQVPAQIDGWASGATAIAARGLFTAAIINQSVMRLTNSGATLVPGMGSGANGLAIGEYGDLCAIISGGLKCRQGFGMIDSTTYSQLGPLDAQGNFPMPSLTENVTAVSLGSYHGCAVKNGAAICWGRAPGLSSSYGYDEDWVPPRVIPGLGASVRDISAGLATSYSYTCATVGPSIWCWGWDNNPPRLGVGANVGSTKVPMPVINLR